MTKEQILEAADTANAIVSKAKMPVDYATIFSAVINAMSIDLYGQGFNDGASTLSTTAGVGRPSGGE